MTSTGHITIGDLRPRVQYVADGTVTAFSYPFPIFDTDNLEVHLDQTPQTAGFTVTGAGDSAGGTVTFDTAPAAGALVTLRRRLAVKRVSDFQEGGAFRAKVVNDELDYQTAVIQQMEVDISRCLRLSPTDPSTAALDLPPVTPGKAIGWNDDGTGLTNDPADFVQVRADVQAKVDAAQAHADAAAASAQQAADATEAILLPTVDAQEAAIAAEASETSAAASASAAAASETAAAASAAAVTGEAQAAAQWSGEAQTLLWITDRNRLQVSDAAATAASARAAAETAAADALLSRVQAEIAADRAASAAQTATTVVVGTAPWQVLPNWAAVHGG